MVASLNYDQYTPFPRPSPPEPEGFQSSEDDSELHSPVFEQPLAAFLPIQSRFQPIASDCLLPHDALIAPPFNSQCNVQSQGFGAHHYGYPKEPPNTALAFNASVQSHTQSFTSSAYELAMPHCFPLLMDSALNRSTTTSVDVPSSAPQINPSHFHLSHPPATTSAPIPQAPLNPPADTIDPSTSAIAVSNPDASVASSSRAGPPRNPSSGVIACRQCRSRKIRCDSTRPNCQNCIKRGNECVYDKVPKRRGPDKRPGTRKRSCKKRQSDGSDPQPKKKRRADPVDQGTTSTYATYDQYEISSVAVPMFGPTHPKTSKIDTEPHAAAFHDAYYVKRLPSPSPTSTQPPSTSHPSRSEIQQEQTFARPFESDLPSPELSSYEDPSPSLANSPEIQYPRKGWWDDILDTYSSTREQALGDLTNDLNILFTSCSHWLTFFNVHRFLHDLFDPNARGQMQPALVYACLAMSMLIRSSEIELGASGRAHALRLRDAAQAHLHESWNLQWIDLGLAEAAMVLALFETSAHPQHHDASVEAALILLDKIIETLRLTTLDARDPDTLDHSTGVPTVANPRPPPKQCDCTTSPVDGSTSTLTFQPVWDPSWTDAEVKSEETRRLCWSALILVANHTAARAAEQRQPVNLFLVDPSNFRLLFPGEYHQRREYVSPYTGKDTIWALYCRSMLLWNCTLRFWDERLTTEERTRIACAAYVETRAVEDALDAHICNLDTALIYMCREFISNTRLEVTYLTRSILLDLDMRSAKPAVWNRRLAEEWLFYQEQVAKRIKNPLTRITEPSAHVTLRRPFHVGWFANQVATCLALWEGDGGLLRALELAKSFLLPLEVLNSLWPSQAFHVRGEALRGQLSQACANAGIPLPPDSTTPDFAPLHPVPRAMPSSR